MVQSYVHPMSTYDKSNVEVCRKRPSESRFSLNFPNVRGKSLIISAHHSRAYARGIYKVVYNFREWWKPPPNSATLHLRLSHAAPKTRTRRTSDSAAVPNKLKISLIFLKISMEFVRISVEFVEISVIFWLCSAQRLSVIRLPPKFTAHSHRLFCALRRAFNFQFSI